MDSIREMILSEDYADIILPTYPCFLRQYQKQGAQLLNEYYGMIHYPLTEEAFVDYSSNGFYYNTIPKLYTLLDTVNLDSSGITAVQNQPILNLKGQNILMGFLDTGIDYTHPAFLTRNGSSRIYRLWDQTIQNGTAPYEMHYGSMYTQEDINAALSLEDPFSLVPSRDENGHGTALAGIAAGSSLPEDNFNGAAPESLLVVVKLKEAKQYLKNLFYITGDAPAYQMTDIMMGIRFLLQVAQEAKMPLVICLGMGTNQGAHSGNSPLDSMLDITEKYREVFASVAAGNEAGKAHHYYGTAINSPEYQTVEVLVDPGTQGFCAELWGQPPEIYAVGFESPLGNVIEKIQPRISYSENISFLLENTRIFVASEILQTISGNQLIFMRFTAPTPGAWKIRVYTNNYNSGNYHIWLPITGFSNPNVRFLVPNPDTTLTAPASSLSVITSAAYNAYDNSLFFNSSRGYTRKGQIKPDLAAPGVNIMAPAPKGGYQTITGTSAAAAHTAGACALLAQWGLNRTPPRTFNNAELKSLLIRGADRNPDKLYPNREWGYGTLNVYQVFSVLSSS